MEYWVPLAVGSALLLALGNVTMRLELVSNRNLWSALGGMMFWGIVVLFPFSGAELRASSFKFSAETILPYLIVGLLHFFLARVVYFKAVQLGGASVASASSAASEPILTAILSVLLIRKEMTLYVSVGAIIAAASVAMLQLDDGNKQKLSYSILLGMMSGAFAGFAAVVLRLISISNMALPPVTGVLFAYVVSFIPIVAIVRPSKLKSAIWNRMLFVSGIFLVMAHILRFAALKYGGATEVTVLVLSYPLFILVIAGLVKQANEPLTMRKALAALGVVLANVLVVWGG